MESYGRQNEAKKYQLMKSDCGLIEGEFVNSRVLQGFFMQNDLRPVVYACLPYLSSTYRRSFFALYSF